MNSQNRVELQHRKGSFRSLVDQLNTVWPSFVTHSFVTREQRGHIKLIKTSSNLTTFAVAQIDFAENFSFVTQKEVQSAHWNQKQATVFTVFIKVGSDHRSMVIISNYMDHDTILVYCPQQQITQYIRENYPNISKSNYVRFGISAELPLSRLILSNGAASQFKNNKNITNLPYHYQDFSLEAAWTFNSSGHGKGPCDGLGAVVKSAARKHLLKQGPEGSFSTAKELTECHQFHGIHNNVKTLSMMSMSISMWMSQVTRKR